METLLQDLRYSVRSLIRTPAFTLVAALTLALGIGANTAIFSVLYGVLLRPLPYPQPERLVELAQVYQGHREERDLTWSQYRFIHDNARVFETSAAATSVGYTIQAGGTGVRVEGLHVSSDFFRVFGVVPAVGRTFTTDEDQEGGPAVVILSHGLWVRHFAGDSSIVGRTVTVDGVPRTVVGVLPESYHSSVDLWTTLAQVGRSIGSGTNLEFYGRLAPGLSVDAAQLRFQSTVAAFRETFKTSHEEGIELESMQSAEVRGARAPVQVLFGAIGFVLLIACANVANLLLGRAAVRGRELALRAALGATRGRVIRQLVTESIVLAALGGALGLIVADWGLQALLRVAPRDLAGNGDIRLDGWALGFTLLLSLLTGLIFGLVPAWRATGVDVHETLKEGSGRATIRQGLRGGLVVAEVALSLILLVGSGLLIGTVRNLVRTDPGFDSKNLLTAEIWLSGTGLDSTADISSFYDRLIQRLKTVPGVRAAGVVEAGLPLQRGGNMEPQLDGKFTPYAAEYRTVTPGYLDQLGVPLLSGRMLTDQDRAGAEPVVVVSRAFVHQFMADSSAVGHLIRYGEKGVDRRIVGVVGDLRSFIGRKPAPAVFLPSAQTPAGMTRAFTSWFPTHVVIRTAGDPEALRAALPRVVREVEERVPVGRVRTMDEVLADSLACQRVLMLLLTVFAALAMVLAAVGLYGVMSNLVTQRTHEIGVRMALGGRSIDVLRLVVGRGMVFTGLGVAAGLVGAALLTRFLRGELYGVQPIDPLTFGAMTAVLVGVAFAACVLPARRATRVDPLVALRSE